jgi:hypothetical protein
MPPPLRQTSRNEPPAAKSGEGDLLEKAKKDPIARSFMDVFPGPVSVEMIEK